jgi:hypothetical protein
LRHAPTLDETRALLQTVQDRSGYPTRLITRLLETTMGYLHAESLSVRSPLDEVSLGT